MSVTNHVFIENSIQKNSEFSDKLVFTEKNKVFDPKKVYGNIPNPTKL